MSDEVTTRQSSGARIPVSFGNQSRLTVSIGNGGDGDLIETVIHDTNGDGRAVLIVHPTAANGPGDTVVTVSGGDRRSLSADLSANESIDPAKYGIRVFANGTGGSPDAVGTLLVLPDNASAGQLLAAGDRPANGSSAAVFGTDTATLLSALGAFGSSSLLASLGIKRLARL